MSTIAECLLESVVGPMTVNIFIGGVVSNIPHVCTGVLQ